MNNGYNSKENIKLECASTFFMIPFYYEGEWDDIHKRISRWKPQEEELYKEDILYPYIMELFKIKGNRNQKENSTIKGEGLTNRLEIYQLYTDDKGSASEFFFDRVLGKKNVAILENTPSQEDKPYPITFRILNEGNNAPHLFISPSAMIGIMTFCAELEKGCDIQDLQLFNYFLHKRNEISKVVIEKVTLPNEKVKAIKNDWRTSNYRIICPSPETNNKQLSSAKIMEYVAQYLTPNGFKQLTNEVQNINNEHINWDINYFIGFLLNTLGKSSQIKYFNKERIHIYTFCSVDSTESSGLNISFDSIKPEALRLSRVVNNKYLLPFDELVQKGALLQTYQNICFSSAIEGTSMICVAKDVNKAFVGDMQNKFNRQYLLVYLLVLLQRYTLLSIDRRLTEYDARNDNTDDDLWNMINLICKIKVNCYYTDVSVYTHHSQFYQHCCKNLNIPDTFKEIDEKIELLKLTTDRKMHLLMEVQRQIQEEEAKKQEEERKRLRLREEAEEKQHEIDKAKEAEAKDAAERRQHLLNGIVAVLTIAQVMQAAYELLKEEEAKDFFSLWISIGVGIFCAILLIALMWKDIKDFFSKMFN